jgi:ferritin-like metal-binding protein YciE
LQISNSKNITFIGNCVIYSTALATIFVNTINHINKQQTPSKNMKNIFTKAKQKKSRDVKQYASEKNADPAKGLRDLFENELKDIYWAEKMLTKALPKMIKNAQSPELINAISEHLDITIAQITRLEKIFGILGIRAVAKKCEAMSGLIQESEAIIANTTEGLVRDAGIISSAQKIEHYEIATYWTLGTFAESLGELEVAHLMKLTLDEEKEADEILTSIAKSSINLRASEEADYSHYRLRTA